jgi:hypothetical protein
MKKVNKLIIEYIKDAYLYAELKDYDRFIEKASFAEGALAIIKSLELIPNKTIIKCSLELKKCQIPVKDKLIL